MTEEDIEEIKLLKSKANEVKAHVISAILLISAASIGMLVAWVL